MYPYDNKVANDPAIIQSYYKYDKEVEIALIGI